MATPKVVPLGEFADVLILDFRGLACNLRFTATDTKTVTLGVTGPPRAVARLEIHRVKPTRRLYVVHAGQRDPAFSSPLPLTKPRVFLGRPLRYIGNSRFTFVGTVPAGTYVYY